MKATYKLILEYMKALGRDFGITVTIADPFHFLLKDAQFKELLYPAMEHRNPYCMLIKSDLRLLGICLKNQQLLTQKLKRCTEPFYGCCWCGTEEYIYPIVIAQRTVAYIAIQGMKSRLRSGTANVITKQLGVSLPFIHEVRDTGLYSLNAAVDYRPYLAIFASLVKSVIMEMPALAKFISCPSALNTQTALKSLQYIRSHYSDNITVKSIADHVNVSPSYLQHLFSEQLNSSVKQIVTNVRTERAKQLLLTTQRSMVSIAMACGYCDANYFSVSFKKQTGLSPKDYRKIKRIKEQDN